jgi:predicted Zn-dependent protease
MRLFPGLALRLVLCGALLCPPAGGLPQQAEKQEAPAKTQSKTQKPFQFTKIENELLERVRQFEKKLKDDGLVFEDPEVTEYINFVGKAVLPDEAPPENVVWKFGVLRDPEANAFALPNGSIYVNTGLLARLENEAQLASVLAHEVTHVLQRHSYLENRSARKKMVAIHVFSAVASVAGQVGGVAGAVVYAVSSMIPMILVGTIFGYSRELEKDADVRAVQAMWEADYSLEEIPNAFKALKNQYEVDLSEGEPAVFYSSHPRLNERIGYITELVNSTRPKTRHPMVEAERYFARTEKAVRHDVGLEIQSGLARTAVAHAKRLVKLNPGAVENHFLLAEAYRALGPRTEVPTDDEKTSDAKKKTRKLLSKSTLREYEATLMATPEGKTALVESARLAEESYRKVLEMDPAFAKAHRGLGFLYERAERWAEAVESFRKYLETATNAPDRAQIVRRLESLEKTIANATAVQQPPD